MKNFADFLAEHRAKIYALAEKNTTLNARGHATISRDDPWQALCGNYRKLCGDGRKVAGDFRRVLDRFKNFS